jgi:alpha-amylase
MMHPREVLQAIPPLGRIYLPNASYAEMNEWALPTASRTQEHEDFVHAFEQEPQWAEYISFVRGGYWRNFLMKYPEINQLHKHVLRTSEHASNVRACGLDASEATRELLAAQCNDPYWHGVFGGAYLPNLRHANFSALVRADRLLDEAENLGNSRIEVRDLDCDGADEIIFESRELSLFVKPSLGGMIAEIDFKGTRENPRNFNATNSISRREEAYHRKLTRAASSSAQTGTKSIHEMVESKEPGLEKLLTYDWYRRGSCIEHFLDEHVSAEQLRTNRYREYGDFISSPFDWRLTTGEQSVELTRSGFVQGKPLRLSKTLEPQNGQLKVTYRIMNDSSERHRLQFASEWVFNVLAPNAPDRFFESNGSRLQDAQMNSSGSVPSGRLRIVDEYLRLAIRLDATEASEIIRYPLESVSTSEAGFERIYQGSVVLAVWQLNIEANDGCERTVTVNFEAL